MARNPAASPLLVVMSCRRPSRRRFASVSANSKIRRSRRFCVSLCGGGRYSPFDTIWVGIGVAAEAGSPPTTRRCSRSLSQEPIVIPPCFSAGGNVMSACGGPPILGTLCAMRGGFWARRRESAPSARIDRGGRDAFHRRIPAERTQRSHHDRCRGCADRCPQGQGGASGGADHLCAAPEQAWRYAAPLACFQGHAIEANRPSCPAPDQVRGRLLCRASTAEARR